MFCVLGDPVVRRPGVSVSVHGVGNSLSKENKPYLTCLLVLFLYRLYISTDSWPAGWRDLNVTPDMIL